MIQITLTFTDDLEAALYFANRLGNTGKVTLVQALGATFSAAVTPVEKAAVLSAETGPLSDVHGPIAGGEAPGKPSDAPTARSPRTAAAAPSTPAPSVAAPAPAPTATPPAAAAPSASAPAEAPFDYGVLAKAVNARVAKYGKAALLAIATKHGAGTFKDLPASAWAAAHADVVALGD